MLRYSTPLLDNQLTVFMISPNLQQAASVMRAPNTAVICHLRVEIIQIITQSSNTQKMSGRQRRRESKPEIPNTNYNKTSKHGLPTNSALKDEGHKVWIIGVHVFSHKLWWKWKNFC